MESEDEKLKNILIELAGALPYCVGIAVTNNHTGVPVEVVLLNPNYCPEKAAANFTVAYLKVAEAQNLMGAGCLREILITGDNHINLLSSLKSGKYHLGVCVESKAQPGKVRYQCRKAIKTLEMILE